MVMGILTKVISRKRLKQMKDTELNSLLEECLQLASEEDKNIISNILTGVKQKLETKEETYISKILQFEKKIEDNTYELTIPVSSLINNNLDIVHGGITATVIDTAMGMMAANTLPAGYACVTTQLNIHYLAPGVGKEITCKARFVHQGSKTIVMESDVHRDDGKKIAHATGSFFIVKK